MTAAALTSPPTLPGDIVYDPGISIDQLKRIPELRAAGVKSVRLTVGGGGRSTHFATVVTSKTKKERFERD